ncbi:alpha/beta hydrolase [Corynebacterium timonense]|uniref:S-formylglutathione hydrolase FrmB n=1 Tax=Corynebacterium timonense TaxID=441500 RepID=A0A1H1TBX9_9CORY|nr:alpha/beta hydrolase family protein [Corynebacterium timonense]SDS57654.1 S-formylglutathione hydrolase FrmB [Corynebacterium timonense]
MKITRPAVAASAAIAIALGAIPATAHLSAEPLSEPPLHEPTVNFRHAKSTLAAEAGDTSVLEQALAKLTESGAASNEGKDTTDAGAAQPATSQGTKSPKAAAPAAAVAPTLPAGESGAAIAQTAATQGAAEQGASEQDAAAEDPAEQTVQGVTQLAAAPVDYQGKPQTWFGTVQRNAQWEALSVHSPAMERDIPVAVRWATDTAGQRVQGAPTVYLLNGAGGSEQNTDWIAQAYSQVEKTFRGQAVNVVIPMEGAFSYYVDWQSVPAQNTYYKGKQLWTTFLGDELPQAIEAHLGANGKRAVVGFSMSATSALLLAEQRPGTFDAVGAFSGCPATSTPVPYFATQLTLNRGGATPEQVWGPMGSDYNRSNDALVNAEKLAGTALYVSNASGLAGETDLLGYYLNDDSSNFPQASSNAFTLQVEGGVIEGVTNSCTHDLKAKLDSKGIPANFNFRNTGTHSWPYWLDDLSISWTETIGPALTGKPSAELGPK